MVAPAVGAALIGGGASLLGGIFGGKGAKKAADAQVKSGEMAIGEMRRQYDQTRSDMAPWREAGGQAIGSLSAMLQPGYDHTTSPGYQFRLDEGMRALEGSAAARGGLLSGGTIKGATRYAQDYAANDFNDQFNRTASVAAGGQQVGMGLGQMGAMNSANIGNTMMGIGNARASGYVGGANAMNGALNNIGGLAAMYMMQQGR